MFSSQLTALAYILMMGSCAVVYHDNMGNMTLELKTLKIEGKIVGDSIALVGFDADELMARCPETGAIHLLNNRHDFEKFMVGLVERGPRQTTIITLAANRSIDCRETIKMALPATQRFASPKSGMRSIRVFHLCSDLESSAPNRTGKTPLWLMHRRISAPLHDDPDAILDRVGQDSNSSSFIEAHHYVRYRAEEYEKHVHINDQCSARCRRFCTIELGPTDRLCETATLDDYHQARAKITSWSIGIVTVEDCSALSVRQTKLLACDRLAPPRPKPSLILLALAVPPALSHLLVHVRLEGSLSRVDRCAVIDGLLAALVLWTRELVAYLFEWPSSGQWQADNQPIRDAIDRRLLSLSVATSFLLFSNLINWRVGRCVRVLAVVYLILEAVLSLKLLMDDDYWNAGPLKIYCQLRSKIFVVVWCFVAATAIILQHVMKTSLLQVRDAVSDGVGPTATKVLIIDGLAVAMQSSGVSCWWTLAITTPIAIVLILMSGRNRASDCNCVSL